MMDFTYKLMKPIKNIITYDVCCIRFIRPCIFFKSTLFFSSTTGHDLNLA